MERSQPEPKRQWHPLRLVLSILLCLAVAVVIMGMMQQAGAKTAVLVLARQVPESAVITRDDLTAVSIAGDITALGAESVDQVVGQRAAHHLNAGAVLQAESLLPADFSDGSQASVGIAVPMTLAPDGLKAGDKVRVLQVPDSSGTASGVSDDAAQVLADDALITVVNGSDSSSDELVLTLRVRTEATGPLLVASSRGQVGLVQLG
ncbi:SAF domain-containing protein [Kineosporia babensis]|uniref:SAF domain-containing protein n=1 Tax=Kineosporia babensis TaxID=499548 RepID=A0A9X1NN05_9ACTN|nr:SAF domain-containing protein [Kineosporia babensis]